MLLGMREVEYDGLNRRIRKVVENCGDGLVPGSDDLDGNGTPDATGIPFANRSEHYYYAGWRVIEERDNNGSAGRVLAQTVYGTEYIDEPVCRDRNLDVSTDSTPAADDCLDGSGGTTGSTRYFYHQDANYRVAALTNESGTVVERYEYEAYGEPRVHVGQPAGGTYESGALVSTSYVGNPLMHQGLRRDDEVQTYDNRRRSLNSKLGQFSQRDPLGYIDTLNLYEYSLSDPVFFIDPFGTDCFFSCWGCGKALALAKQIGDACNAAELDCLAKARDRDEGLDNECFDTADCRAEKLDCLQDSLDAIATAIPECAKCIYCKYSKVKKGPVLAKAHRKGKSESKRGKHEKGKARDKKDKGGEKGDERRRGNPNKPDKGNNGYMSEFGYERLGESAASNSITTAHSPSGTLALDTAGDNVLRATPLSDGTENVMASDKACATMPAGGLGLRLCARDAESQSRSDSEMEMDSQERTCELGAWDVRRGDTLGP